MLTLRKYMDNNIKLLREYKLSLFSKIQNNYET